MDEMERILGLHGWSEIDSTTELHRQAMELADQAFVARRSNHLPMARSFAYRAYVLEKQAAEQSITEPTRSVLHRSAATLALDCGEYREAERLVAAALSGSPPEPIANELREVLDATYKAWNWREHVASL